MTRTLRNDTDKTRVTTPFAYAPIPPAAKATGPLGADRWSWQKDVSRPPALCPIVDAAEALSRPVAPNEPTSAGQIRLVARRNENRLDPKPQPDWLVGVKVQKLTRGHSQRVVDKAIVEVGVERNVKAGRRGQSRISPVSTLISG
jgi:hypothetical protein